MQCVYSVFKYLRILPWPFWSAFLLLYENTLEYGIGKLAGRIDEQRFSENFQMFLFSFLFLLPIAN